jgi:hypothetical protein
MTYSFGRLYILSRHCPPDLFTAGIRDAGAHQKAAYWKKKYEENPNK